MILLQTKPLYYLLIFLHRLDWIPQHLLLVLLKVKNQKILSVKKKRYLFVNMEKSVFGFHALINLLISRNNKEHLQQYQHPWKDKTESKKKPVSTSTSTQEKKSINPENKPTCKYGSKCYQKKPDHLYILIYYLCVRSKFFHPPAEDKDATQEIVEENLKSEEKAGDETDEMEEAEVKRKLNSGMYYPINSNFQGYETDEMSDSEIKDALKAGI